MASPASNHATGRSEAATRSARYQRQRTRIIDAAVVLMNEKGVSGMTLQEVAQHLALTTTSVTYYFRYKEQLAAAVFEDTMARLSGLIAQAATEVTPRARVARYVELSFAQLSLAMRGQDRPMAILSEMRALEGETKAILIAQYQDIFRAVRQLFGDIETEEQKLRYSCRAQLLNEALFWSALWLRRYPLGDLPSICRRMVDILENGLGVNDVPAKIDIINPYVVASDDPKYEFLRVASRLINDLGYKGASVERIVGELRITKGSFYHHLEAKDDLMLECYREDYQRLGRLFAMIDMPGRSAGEKIIIGIASALNLQFDGTHPLLRTTALQAMPQNVRRAAIEQFDRSAVWLSGVLVDGMQEGAIRIVDPMIAANVIISTINSAYDLRSWARKQDRSEAVANYASVLMQGLFR